MDVLKISDTKIKIMLSSADIKSYGLDPTADYSDKATRTSVFKILDYVKKHYGFNHDGAKLLIQFYPSKDGGAELFVTKLTGLLPKVERAISKSEDITMLESKRRIYRFREFEDLLRAAKILKCREGNIGESELFFSDDDGYYLEIAERGSHRIGGISELAILSEFSEYVPREKHPYIIEHFKKLTGGNAVELLAKL